MATSGRVVREDLSEKRPEGQGDLGKGELEDSEVGMNWVAKFSQNSEAVSEQRAGGEGLGGGQGPPVRESFGGQGKECGLYRKVEMTPTGGFPVWSDISQWSLASPGLLRANYACPFPANG